MCGWGFKGSLRQRIKLHQNDQVRDEGTGESKEHVVVDVKESTGREPDPGEHGMEPIMELVDRCPILGLEDVSQDAIGVIGDSLRDVREADDQCHVHGYQVHAGDDVPHGTLICRIIVCGESEAVEGLN